MKGQWHLGLLDKIQFDVKESYVGDSWFNCLGLALSFIVVIRALAGLLCIVGLLSSLELVVNLV